MQVRFVSCVHCCSAERSILISSVAWPWMAPLAGLARARRDVAPAGSGIFESRNREERMTRCARARSSFFDVA